MQKSINLFLTTAAVLIIFGLVFYFLFGRGGKVDQVNKQVDNIEQAGKENRLQVQNELQIQTQ